MNENLCSSDFNLFVAITAFCGFSTHKNFVSFAVSHSYTTKQLLIFALKLDSWLWNRKTFKHQMQSCHPRHVESKFGANWRTILAPSLPLSLWPWAISSFPTSGGRWQPSIEFGTALKLINVDFRTIYIVVVIIEVFEFYLQGTSGVLDFIPSENLFAIRCLSPNLLGHHRLVIDLASLNFVGWIAFLVDLISWLKYGWGKESL